jgi:hypothetical protein
MGMIRGAVDKAGSMKDIDSHGNAGFAGDRALPVAGHECCDGEIGTGAQSGEAPDSWRSRGYGRYEI